MRVLHASAEVAPFSKAGGLGDVVGALPRALARLGAEVLVVSPWHSGLGGRVSPSEIGDVVVPFAGRVEPVDVGTLETEGVRYAFIGHEDYRRGAIYGFEDDLKRFVRFARAVPAVAARVGFVPDLVHAHDWHAALIPVLLEHGAGLPLGLAHLPTVLTVHNVQFQGSGALEDVLTWSELPGDLRGSHLEQDGRANLLQGGVGFADLVTTVSPSYARELTGTAHAFGLEEIFQRLNDFALPAVHEIIYA